MFERRKSFIRRQWAWKLFVLLQFSTIACAGHGAVEESQPRGHAPVRPDAALHHARPLQVESGGARTRQLQAPLQKDGELVSQRAALQQQRGEVDGSLTERMLQQHHLQRAAQPLSCEELHCIIYELIWQL